MNSRGRSAREYSVGECERSGCRQGACHLYREQRLCTSCFLERRRSYNAWVAERRRKRLNSRGFGLPGEVVK